MHTAWFRLVGPDCKGGLCLEVAPKSIDKQLLKDKVLLQQVTMVDGFAGVYPEHKHRIVAALQSKGRLVGMTGALIHVT